MEFVSVYIIPVLVPSLLTAVIILLVAILYNVRNSTKAHKKMQQKEKEPEEHDERFATGKRSRFSCTNYLKKKKGSALKKSKVSRSVPVIYKLKRFVPVLSHTCIVVLACHSHRQKI